jgi:hypothetical protein
VRRSHDLFGRTTAVVSLASANAAISAVLEIAGLLNPSGNGITIAKSPTHQGIHDRLAGGTNVVRRLPSTAID